MRDLFRPFLVAACLLACGLLAPPAAAQDLIPAKRLALSENTDRPGGDIATLLDTTLEACQRACLTNAQCQAITFNTRNGSCFVKSGAGAAVAFDRAFSGEVLLTDPTIVAAGAERRGELSFLFDWDFSAAQAQAEGHLPADWDAHQVTFELHGLVLALHHEARFLRSASALTHARRGFERVLGQRA